MKSHMMTAQDLIVQKEGFLVSDMDGEKVMMSIQNGKYYNLGNIGGRIWELAAAPISLSLIVDQLVAEYDIEREVCDMQVQAFVTQLVEEGLIQVKSGS
ncbi:lasso peptide biosynthesis PqqD family chaperone [Paenibacillus sp. F411]|uniref:Uncharacterized protein n=1 Tax=Paenibacillus algicola TaxID=2565926 RepID=A0A4P8XQR1_9BACL|nr:MULTISPECIES: lasso peptide biosynthesis PqqD family chaperone [Paenibacillus]MBO2943784.1 lasso peptide biosynthesis PqqD family chaperone [Paenibacillus sp. F411]QCT04071.1 hypothetical protein E6C60_3360 [Paenibacillus algicola]